MKGCSSFTLQAYAKINTHLDVGPRQPNGYHQLKTVFQEISLHDTLRFKFQKKDITLSVAAASVPKGSQNLIVKALLGLKKKLGITHGIHVDLLKRIPVGAGLGGGSSDAAAALWGGWVMWTKERLEAARNRTRVPLLLQRCAPQLGADVPFFLRGGRAWAEGIGDQLVPLPNKKEQWLVIVYPRLAISTKWAYARLDQQSKQRRSFFPGGVFAPCNSFEAVLFEREPVLSQVRTLLKEYGCSSVLLSGSGSAMFGALSSFKQGQAIQRVLSRKPWDVFLTKTRGVA